MVMIILIMSHLSDILHGRLWMFQSRGRAQLVGFRGKKKIHTKRFSMLFHLATYIS